VGYKLIYLAKRNPTIAAADFGAAWTSHADFANQYADTFSTHFKSARQCVKIHDADVPASFRNDHDGTALLAMKNWESLGAARTHPIVADELKRDEERVFADYVDNWTMPTEEYNVVKRGGGRAFLLSFLTRRPDTDELVFQERLADACTAMVSLPALGTMTRLVHNRVLERREPPYDFSAVVEVWFATEEQAITAANNRAVIAALEQGEIADVERGSRLLTRLNNI
jgi:hypothetical protein